MTVGSASSESPHPYETRQRKRSPPDQRVSSWGQISALIQEHPMADLAFVVTTIAVFALVALIAKGVTKL
ncbi:hypothetical protein ACFXKF_23250 [Streptomyces scopuliridis]